MDKLKFLLDEHIDSAIAQALRRRGIDVLTAAEAELLGAPDADYLARSLAEQRVVVTRDRDFTRLHQGGVSHSGIIYYEQGQISIGDVVFGLTLAYEALEPTQMIGRLEFL